MKQIKSHRRRSNRLGVLLTAGAMGLAGAAVMSIPTVYADPVPTNGPTVRFSGGCLLGLTACNSKPDQSNVSMPAGQVVTIVNEMNADGYVVVGGEKVTVPKGGSRGFQINSGPQDLRLIPTAIAGGLLSSYKPVHITVTAPPAEKPTESTPDNNNNDSSAGGNTGNSSRPAQPNNSSRDSGSTGPEAPIRDPKAQDAVPPAGDEEVPPADEAPQPDATEETQDAVPPATDGDDSRNAEAVQPLDSKPASNQSSSLLALIATVCLVGVAAAAIRTIITQRAARAAHS